MATHQKSNMVCRPIDSFNELVEFVQNPPAWTALCKDLVPHSQKGLLNSELANSEPSSGRAADFCHTTREAESSGYLMRRDLTSLPKTLVCHDMKNGYHDDSYVNGTSAYDAYCFYNWAAVDIFCYFSHHLVTIPPLSWVNVAHEHGVQVIGTLITEGDDGVSFWEDVLSSESRWKQLADLLVEAARAVRMEGWLLNIENRVSRPSELVEFVRYLQWALRQTLLAPRLLWYDSVTHLGVLHWQNALNEQNRVFFDICDGIYTNYSWSERELQQSAGAAVGRRADVFVGLDVWGRRFLGGGRHNSKEAASLIHKYGFSMAVFAPAWTHEPLAPSPPSLTSLSPPLSVPLEPGASSPPRRPSLPPPLSLYERFLLRDRALWGGLWPFLCTRPPSALPFMTSFCRGHGLKDRRRGEVVNPSPWFNLTRMQYQPNSSHSPQGYLLTSDGDLLGCSRIDEHGDVTTFSILNQTDKKQNTKHPMSVIHLPHEKEPLEVYLKDSFQGGSCLKVNGDGRLIRLFHCDFFIEDGFVVCVVTKSLPGVKDSLSIELFGSDSEGREVWLVLGEGRGEGRGVAPATGRALADLQIYLSYKETEFYVPAQNAHGWNVRYYSAPARSFSLSSVCAEGAGLLGHLGICQRSTSDTNYVEINEERK